MGPRTEMRVSAGFWLAFMALALLRLLIYWHSNDLVGYHRMVAHSERVIAAVQATLVTAAEAEAAHRGHLITGSSDDLAAFHDAAERCNGHALLLRRLTADNPAQQQRLDRLQPALAIAFDQLKRTADVRRDAGYETARDMVASRAAQRELTSARELLERIGEEEERLLASRTADADASARRGLLSFYTVTVIDFTLLLLCYRVVRQYVAYRNRTHAEALANAEALRRAKEAAEAANREKDHFLAVASHDLRGPLSAISLWVGLLRQRPDDPKLWAKGLALIDESVRAQSQIIEDLLDTASMAAGQLRVEPVPTDLAEVVRRVADAMQPSATQAELSLTAQLPETRRLSRADPARVRQVLTNLLTNAVKFSEKGGAIRVALEYDDAAGVARISVIDQGRGISPEFLPHVFERFRQEPGRSRRGGGLGLGLSIVRELVRLHGGTIEARSEGVGKGSTFVVTLPLVGTPTDAAPPAPAAATTAQHSPSPS